MITITQESEDLYRAEYSALEAAECAEDFRAVEHGDTDLTAALNVQRGIDDQEDADAVVSACMKLRTCGNCKFVKHCAIRRAILNHFGEQEFKIMDIGCNAWERKT
jgi:hypothetical protein